MLFRSLPQEQSTQKTAFLPPTLSLPCSYRSLRVDLRAPAPRSCPSGGAAAWSKVEWSGWYVQSSLVLLVGVMPVTLVEFGSRSPDSIGRIWCVLVSVFLDVLFWWQELRHGRKQELGISPNKAVFPFLWRLFVLVLLRGARRSPEALFVKLSRWTLDVGGKSGEVFFNKRIDCLQCCGLATLFRLLAGLGGGGEKGGSCVVRVTWRWSEEVGAQIFPSAKVAAGREQGSWKMVGVAVALRRRRAAVLSSEECGVRPRPTFFNCLHPIGLVRGGCRLRSSNSWCWLGALVVDASPLRPFLVLRRRRWTNSSGLVAFVALVLAVSLAAS